MIEATIKTYAAGYKIYHTKTARYKTLGSAAREAAGYLGKKNHGIYAGLIQDAEIYLDGRIVWQGWKVGIGYQSKFIRENLAQGELEV